MALTGQPSTDTAEPPTEGPGSSEAPTNPATAAPSRRWYRIVTSNTVIGLALAILVWPYGPSSLAVLSGLDPSWQTALTMAAHNGMPFGTHIVFTYGPLGFLQGQQMNYFWTTALEMLFGLALSAAVMGTLVWRLRRVVPLIAAVAVTYLVGTVTIQHAGVVPEYVLALVLVASVSILRRADTAEIPAWAWVVLGAVLSVFGLLKVSLGVGIAATLLVTVAFLRHGRWRAVAAIAVGAVPTFCVGWFGTGNGVGNTVAFTRGAAAIISGYAPAMSVELPSRLYCYGLAALVVATVAGFALASVRGGGLPHRSVIGIGLVTLLVLWLLFKEGFVRHDAHDLIFFAAAPLVLAAFAPRHREWLLVPGVLALTGVFLLAAIGVVPLVPRPDSAVRNLVSEVTTVASPGRRADVIEQSRRSLRRGYALPPRMVAMVRHRTVDISPWEQTVAWAYPQIRFDPLPVVQNYSAYTPSLDRLDTDYLASPDAPRFILVQPVTALDNRNPAFEPPTTQVAIECRYRQVVANASWQLLERGTDRCGPLTPIGAVTTGVGRWVSVPAAPAGYAVVARFQLSLGWLFGLEAVVFKPPNVFMGYQSGPLVSTFRFVAATAPDLHLLRPASTLGYASGFLPDSISRLRFSTGSSPTGVQVQFYRIRVTPVQAANGDVVPPPRPTIELPADGATVSGTVPLDGGATDALRVTKIEFRLTGPSEHDTLIGTAGGTLFGSVALWNSATVPNGTYTLQSVAYDVGGRTGRSAPITITVDNPSG